MVEKLNGRQKMCLKMVILNLRHFSGHESKNKVGFRNQRVEAVIFHREFVEFANMFVTCAALDIRSSNLVENLS